MYIYLIRDPQTNGVRYVGKTKSPKKRHKQHKRPTVSLYRTNWHFYQYLMTLQVNELEPVMEIVEETSRGAASFFEQVWIHKMLDAGCALFNQKIMPRKKLDKLLIVARATKEE